ncbi:MAG: ATP-binding response regulator, partial [Candidatus Binatia bacterium]
VSDDGIGIAPEMLARVFELFAQVDRSAGRQGGLGIGLSLSRSLVEMHGGTLDGRSDGVGHGSTFTVRIPVDASRDEVAATAAQAEETGNGARPRLLVVDDNVDAAESLGTLLSSLGGDVEVVYDGASALARLEAAPFSAAFVDLGMPVLGGLEVARRIRGEARFADLLLVAVTGWGQDEDRARSREAGFDHHLVKPAELGALQGVLRELREKPAAATRAS